MNKLSATMRLIDDQRASAIEADFGAADSTEAEARLRSPSVHPEIAAMAEAGRAEEDRIAAERVARDQAENVQRIAAETSKRAVARAAFWPKAARMAINAVLESIKDRQPDKEPFFSDSDAINSRAIEDILCDVRSSDVVEVGLEYRQRSDPADIAKGAAVMRAMAGDNR